MATTTYTSGLRLTNQPAGENENTWGDIADDNFEFLDDAVAGVFSVDVTGNNSYTLTAGNGAADEARHATLKITGIPGSANSVIIPASEKHYNIHATHTSVAGGITVRTATGTGVTFLTGRTASIYCDGVSVYKIADATPALQPDNNLSDLTNVSAALVNLDLGGFTDVSTFSSAYFTKTSGVLGFNVSALFNVIWPVGSIYSNRTDGTNPGTLMGFGTWTSAGTGRVLIGVGTGIDANTVSAVFSAQTCGGEYSHTLTTAEMMHTHETGVTPRSILTAALQIRSDSWAFGQGPATYNTYGQGFGSGDAGTARSYLAGPPMLNAAGISGTVSASIHTSVSGFSIQQPWYSVYRWVRTA